MFTKANYKIAMLMIVGSAGLATMSSKPAAPTVQPKSAEFIAAIWEGTLDLTHHGISEHTCIFIPPDARFHLERRTQQLPNPVATLDIFDYSLDAAQLQQLQSILDDEGLRPLPAYVQPAVPMVVPWSHGLNAKIMRTTGVQDIGYWTWRGGTAEVSPNSAPVIVKKGWQESETALQPLVGWLHGIESLKLSPSDAKSTMCVADAN